MLVCQGCVAARRWRLQQRKRRPGGCLYCKRNTAACIGSRWGDGGQGGKGWRPLPWRLAVDNGSSRRYWLPYMGVSAGGPSCAYYSPWQQWVTGRCVCACSACSTIVLPALLAQQYLVDSGQPSTRGCTVTTAPPMLWRYMHTVLPAPPVAVQRGPGRLYSTAFGVLTAGGPAAAAGGGVVVVEVGPMGCNRVVQGVSVLTCVVTHLSLVALVKPVNNGQPRCAVALVSHGGGRSPGPVYTSMCRLRL